MHKIRDNKQNRFQREAKKWLKIIFEYKAKRSEVIPETHESKSEKEIH